MPARMVTLVIHGTFADAELWWRRGSDEAPTFADRLEQRLAAHGMPGSVWDPVFEAGMSEEDFAWSGKNRHRDRIQGAAKLVANLGRLADSLGATEDDPLRVNLVAHSHGGNVALEMLRDLPSNLRARRVTLLGTPLMWRVGSVDLYPIVASLLVFLLLVGPLVASWFDPEATRDLSRAEVAIVAVVSILLLLVFLGPYLLILEKPFVWSERLVSWPVSLIRKGGAGGRPAYGPPGSRLAELVDEPPMLLTSREDEADLALHIGASPREVYSALVEGRLPGALRYVELLWLRGPFSVIVAPLAEAITEHFVLGFSWWNVLFNDYEMVNFQSEDEVYAGSAIRRIDVSEELVPALVAKLSSWRPASSLIAPLVAEGLTEQERHIEALRSTLLGVVVDIRNQMQLRHTVYYETEAVVDRVAGLLAD